MVGIDRVCIKHAKFLAPKYDIMLDIDIVPSKLQILWHPIFLDR